MSSFTEQAQKLTEDKNKSKKLPEQNQQAQAMDATQQLAQQLSNRRDHLNQLIPEPVNSFAFSFDNNDTESSTTEERGVDETLGCKSEDREAEQGENVQQEPVKSLPDFVHPEQSNKYTEKEAQTIYDNLNLLRDNITDKDVVGQVMRGILIGIRENENLKVLMKPEDCGLMVKHLRTEFGVEIKKRSASTTKKRASAVKDDKIADALGELF